LSSTDILRQGGGSFQMRTSVLFGAKIFRFFEIYGVSARTRGVEPMWTFCEQGGSIFAILCVFYGQPLMKKVCAVFCLT